jgi:hypothetical protein
MYGEKRNARVLEEKVAGHTGADGKIVLWDTQVQMER